MPEVESNRPKFRIRNPKTESWMSNVESRNLKTESRTPNTEWLAGGWRAGWLAGWQVGWLARSTTSAPQSHSQPILPPPAPFLPTPNHATRGFIGISICTYMIFLDISRQRQIFFIVQNRRFQQSQGSDLCLFVRLLLQPLYLAWSTAIVARMSRGLGRPTYFLNKIMAPMSYFSFRNRIFICVTYINTHYKYVYIEKIAGACRELYNV